MKTTHYRIIVSPEDIIAQNTSPVCLLLNPQSSDSPARLRALQGKVMILTDEFRFRRGRDRRELYAIPEVRAFYSKLKHDCPYWFYFFPLDVASLWLSTAATLNDVVIERRQGVKQRTLHFNKDELDRFIESLAPATEEICLRAGHRRDFYPRLMRKVADYYINTRFEDGLPRRWLA
jgi:hypothetical protein